MLSALGESRQGPPPVPVPREGPLPLSFSQQRIWFLHRLASRKDAYNEYIVQRIEGELDVRALSKSIREIVRRHEALRTTFPLVDGRPVQEIHPAAPFEMTTVHPREPRDQPPGKWAREFAEREIRRPFDLERGPLFRAKLLCLGPGDHVILITTHHIVFDAGSLGVFREELSRLYPAFSMNRPSPLPGLPIQFADFAAWQRRRLRGERLASLLAYWKEATRGVDPVLTLPGGGPRPPVMSQRGAFWWFTLSEPLSEALRALSVERGATLFMTLLAGFQALLFRLSGQTSFLVGSPASGRNRAEVQGLIGFFVNTLPLRADLTGRPAFLQLLDRVKRTTLEAYARQELPFEKLVGEIRPERSRAHSPLFQVMFTLFDGRDKDLALPGLAVSPMEVRRTTAKVDATLTLEDHGGALKGELEFNTDLFEYAAMARAAEQYVALLEGAVADPGAPVADLPLLTAAERHRLLVEWNDTRRDYPRERCIHRLFEDRAGRSPDRTALVFEGETISRGELNIRANQLARYIRARGAGPGERVGILLERSVEMVVGILAILKAGGAYVPLDPGSPAERIAAFMLGDAGIALLLTSGSFRERLPGAGARVIRVDAVRSEVSRERKGNVSGDVSADEPAYVMYTSGSTGAPKGVVTPHRGVVRLVKGADYADLTPGEVFLQHAPVSFDASTFEIWGPLLNGGRLVIFPPLTPTLKELGRAVRTNGVTTLWLVTDLFHQMVAHGLEDLRGLRQLLTGGDVLSADRVRRFIREVKGCRLICCYGPTENTTFTSCFFPDETWKPRGGAAPIGRPIANTRMYLLDRRLAPVPEGVIGEIYVAGDGLALEYLHRPSQTARAFLPNPFDDSPGGRLYRTGDLARRLPDGALAFAGRADRQVKVRGFRVEPGEIEAALGDHPHIRECAVVVGENHVGDKRIIAHAIPARDPAPAPGALRAYLAKRLPSHMVPSAFLFTDALPRGASGKIARDALPSRAPNAPARDRELVHPRTVIEEMLTRIWADAFHLESDNRGASMIHVYDNFFDLGGDSMTAIRFIAKIHEVFKVELPLSAILEAPFVAGIARLLQKRLETGERGPRGTAASASALTAIQPGGELPPFFMVPGGGCGEFELIHYPKLAYAMGQDQPFYGFHAHDIVERGLDAGALGELAAAFVEEIRRVQPRGPYYLGGDCIGGATALEMARRLESRGEEVALVILIDAEPPGAPGRLHWRLKGEGQERKSGLNRLYNFLLPGLLPMGRGLHHIRRLARIEPGKRLDYIRRKTEIGVEGLQAALKTGRRRPLPMTPAPGERGARASRFTRITMEHRPAPFSGRITLLVTRDNDPGDLARRWTPLAGGGVETHRLQASHVSYLGKDYKATARTLKECLDRARGRFYGFSSPRSRTSRR